jgi:hypothetical protein
MELTQFTLAVDVVADAEVVRGARLPEGDPTKPARRSKLRIQSGVTVSLEQAQEVALGLHDGAFEVITAADGRQRVIWLADVDYWRIAAQAPDLFSAWFVERDGQIMNPGWVGSLDTPATG